MKVEVTSLQTIKNYAQQRNVTPSYIYKLIKEQKMDSFTIDGVQFVDNSKFPTLPVKK